MKKKKIKNNEIPLQDVTLSNPELSNEIESSIYTGIERRSGFWQAIIKDTMDIYSLSTALYVFLVILPIVLSEIKRTETRTVNLKLFGYEFGEIPMALQIVLVSVLLTTIVNYFRMILNLGMSWIKRKLDMGEEKE